MKKIFLVAALLFLGREVLAQEAFVRKQREPDFFIPNSAKIQPERLVMPRYHLADDLKQPEPEQPRYVKVKPKVKKKVQNKPELVVRYNKEDEQTSQKELEPEAIMSDFANTPVYQRNYTQYSKDLEEIGKTGKIPYNAELENDLAKMNSEQRIVLEKKPQANSVKERFDEALQNSLNN